MRTYESKEALIEAIQIASQKYLAEFAEIPETLKDHRIETVAKTFNGIIDAVCVPKEDETWGQIPALYYVASETIEVNDLINFLQEHLAKYKVPKIYQHVNALPYTSTGKLQRNKVGTEDH